MPQHILKSKGAQERFLATGRMNPTQARAMRARMQLTRKRAGLKPAPAPKKPAEKGERMRTLPLKPEGKPKRIKKPAKRIGGPTRIR